MKLSEITQYLNEQIPLALQEPWDNCGLITGNLQQEITSALLCIDSTEEVIDEAINGGHQLIIAHHPIVFNGLKKFTGNDYVQRSIIKSIKNNIAIYAMHTNLDNHFHGVNFLMAQKLGLKNLKILSPKKHWLKQLVTYVPTAKANDVREALFKAGGGAIGNYDECSFNTEGVGTFKGNEDSHPTVGNKGMRHLENETRIELVFPFYHQAEILKALFLAHPYEEVAYEIINLENQWNQTGSGMVGEMETALSASAFLQHVKTSLNTPLVKYTDAAEKSITRVAVCGGSGFFLLPDAIQSGAQAFITSDIKYHQFFAAQQHLMLCDIGHYESEQFTMELFQNLLKQKFHKFATAFTKTKTNPINYF